MSVCVSVCVCVWMYACVCALSGKHLTIKEETKKKLEQEREKESDHYWYEASGAALYVIRPSVKTHPFPPHPPTHPPLPNPNPGGKSFLAPGQRPAPQSSRMMGSLVLEGRRGMGGARGGGGGGGSLMRTGRWGFRAARRISDWVRCFLRALDRE